MRIWEILEAMGFAPGNLPFRYLEAPIFKGASKGEYFTKIAEKIHIQIASWKGMLISMVGRVQLEKFVIQNMMVYTMIIF